MKRLFISLAIALVLVAAVVMPAMAANPDSTDITGDVPFTIDVTAPSDIDFVTFSDGENSASSTDGTVVCNGTTWSVEAKDLTNGGYMKDGATPLGAKMTICDTSGGTYVDADTGITYSGEPTTLELYVKQTVDLATDPVGSYSITITFTGSGS